MNEILPGIHHWTAIHPNLGVPVSSYYVEPAATILDPLAPEEGLEWFEGRPVERVVLTIRHHLRNAAQFAERFGVPVLVNERGLDEVKDTPGIATFAAGDEIAPGVTTHAVYDGWPDETALRIDQDGGVLAIADSVIRYGGAINFVPEQYMGPDPEADKAGLTAGLRSLLELDFDAILFAHGDPIASGGKEALRAFVEAQPA